MLLAADFRGHTEFQRMMTTLAMAWLDGQAVRVVPDHPLAAAAQTWAAGSDTPSRELARAEVR